MNLPPELQQADAEASAAATDMLGSAPPAEEPLASPRLEAVVSALDAALDHMLGEDAEAIASPVAPIAPSNPDAGGAAMMDAMPADLYAGLQQVQMALQAAVESGMKGAERYVDFDVEGSATTNDGLAATAAWLNAMTTDAALAAPPASDTSNEPAPDDAAGPPAARSAADMAADL